MQCRPETDCLIPSDFTSDAKVKKFCLKNALHNAKLSSYG